MTTSTSARAWVLALTAAASVMVSLDQLVVATALPSIRADLHASITTLDWTVNGYSLTFAVLLLTGAALGDRFGRRRVFLIGLTLFTLASAACALSGSPGPLVGARVVQGLGAALTMPQAVALLTAAFPPDRRGRAVGAFTGLTGLAVVGGPVVGGAIAQGIAWQWIFWVNVPIGAVLVPLAATHIAQHRPGRARLDPGGLLLAATGTGGVVWGLIRGATAGWGSVEVLTAFVLGAAGLVTFVRWERRAPVPMLPMHLFGNRNFAAGNAATLLFTASLIGSVFLFAQYLQLAMGFGPLDGGLGFLPFTAAIFVMAPLSGVLVGRVGPRPLLVVGASLQTGGLAWLALAAHAGASYASLVPALVVAGSGATMALPAGQTAVMDSVAPQHVGTAAGTFNSMRQLGGALGVAVLSAVFAAAGGYGSPADFRTGAAPALAAAALLGAAGVCAALCVTRKPATKDSAVADTELVDA